MSSGYASLALSLKLPKREIGVKFESFHEARWQKITNSDSDSDSDSGSEVIPIKATSPIGSYP